MNVYSEFYEMVMMSIPADIVENLIHVDSGNVNGVDNKWPGSFNE